MFSLSCEGVRTCEKTQDGYVCHLGDSNYLFSKCETILIEPAGDYNPNEDLKNFRIIYEQNGKHIEEPIYPSFTFKYDTTITTAYRCDITRPASLPMIVNKVNPARVELHFESDIECEKIQLWIKNSHEDNHI